MEKEQKKQEIKINKRDFQFRNAKQGIKYLYEQSLVAKNYNELLAVLDKLMKYTNQANEKNNRPNKSINALKDYYIREGNKRTVENVVSKKEKKKKITYKDFYDEFKALKDNGMSYRDMEDYAHRKLKIKVSYSVLYTFLNKKEKVEEVSNAS